MSSRLYRITFALSLSCAPLLVDARRLASGPVSQSVSTNLDHVEATDDYPADLQDVDSANEGLDLSGAWVRKRMFHWDRHYDIARSEEAVYEGFPISQCFEPRDRSLGTMMTQTRCDSQVSLTITSQEEVDGVMHYVIEKTKVFRYDSDFLQISDSGNLRANGRYMVVQFHNSRPRYQRVDDNRVTIKWSDKRKRWEVKVDRRRIYYSKESDLMMPTTGWTRMDGKKTASPVLNVSIEHPKANTMSKVTISTCGDKRMHGEYEIVGFHNHRPEYKMVGNKQVVIHWSTKMKAWRMFIDKRQFTRRGFRRMTHYVSEVNSYTLPETGWTVVNGTAPAPVLRGKIFGESHHIMMDSVTASVVGKYRCPHCRNQNHDINELQWSDGARWVRYSGADSHLDDWDKECRHQQTIGQQQASDVQYAQGFALVAALQWTRVPGLGVEFVQCISNEWLSAHKSQFQCILGKAREASGSSNNTESKDSMVKALAKVEALLPPAHGLSGAGSCVPNICLGLGFTVFPIPSPVPAVFMLLTWPVRMSACNGVKLSDEITDVQSMTEKGMESEIVTKESRSNKGSLRHGLHIGLFPVPSIGYFFQGVKPVSLGRLFGRRKRVKKLNVTADTSEALTTLEDKIDKAIQACPNIRRRFELHSRRFELTGDVRRMRKDQLREVAASFPELAGKGTATKRKISGGFAVGGFAMVGSGGAALGIFGGPSMSGRKLQPSYLGCRPWVDVIKVWQERPILDVDPEEERVLESTLDDAGLTEERVLESTLDDAGLTDGDGPDQEAAAPQELGRKPLISSASVATESWFDLGSRQG